MIIISAMGRNRVIGNGDGMPWHVPEEYQHFLDTTRDQTIIIGRRSFEIFGPTLTCAHCNVEGPNTYYEAKHKGWTSIQYMPAQTSENFLGICFTCNRRQQ